MRRGLLSLVIILTLFSPAHAGFFGSGGASGTLTAVTGGAWIPEFPAFTTSGPAFASASGTIDASGEKFAQTFMATKSCTVDVVEFLLGTVAQSPTNGLTVSLQDPAAANGDPDGTQDQYRTVATGSISTGAYVVTGKLTSDGTDNGTQRAMVAGDVVQLVIEFTSFVAGDSVIMAMLDYNGTAGTNTGNYPFYPDLYTGSWTKGNDGLSLAVKCLDGTYMPLGVNFTPLKTLTTVTTLNTGSTPDQYGMNFQFPVGVKVDGLRCYIDFDEGVTLDLLDNSSNSLTSGGKTLDKDIRSGTGEGMATIFFPATTLTANTNYRVSILPTTATNIRLFYWTANAAGNLAAVPGGTTWYLTSRTDAGAWDTTATASRPWCAVHVSSFFDR